MCVWEICVHVETLPISLCVLLTCMAPSSLSQGSSVCVRFQLRVVVCGSDLVLMTS